METTHFKKELLLLEICVQGGDEAVLRIFAELSLSPPVQLLDSIQFMIVSKWEIIAHLFNIALSFSATFGCDFPRSFRKSVSNSLLATWFVNLKQIVWLVSKICTSSKKYLPQLLTHASSKVMACITTCGSWWLRRLTRALKHSLGPVLVAPTLREMRAYNYNLKHKMNPPVTHRHDEAPVLRSVLLIGDFLHQSVKLRLRVPKDPHLIGFLVELI